MNIAPHVPMLSIGPGSLGAVLDGLRSTAPATPEVMEKVDRWRSILDDDSLSREEKQNRLREIDPDGRQTESELIRLKLDADMLEGKAGRHRALIRSLEPYRDWEAEETCRFVLQKNDCSRLHKLTEAIEGGLFFDGAAGEFASASSATANMVRDVKNTFVVRHDWAAALDGAVGVSNEIRLPYPICAFEFRITNKTVLLLAGQAPDGEVKFSAMLEGVEGVWFAFHEEAMREVSNFAWKQVQAISIALDAQVAEHSVIRAPAALNAKREKSGKPPIADFHVVDLSRRTRASALLGGGHSGRGVRMHFRRGHWRHYETHNTWINWMLVGNPDLGFIDKEYRV